MTALDPLDDDALLRVGEGDYDPADFTGDGVPRLRVAPAWDVRPPAAVEAYEQAAAYGLVLDGWQYDGLCDAMVERADGKWDAVEVDEVVARQNGKNAKIRARQLYGLYTIGNRALHTAHEFKTAREHFDKMLAWIEAWDELRREVAKVRTSHGEEGFRLLSGAELRFVARSKGSGRGFDPDDLYYDEALILTKDTLSASLMAQSASPNPQRFFFSSAGTRASEVLGAHRRRALAVLAGRRRRGRFAFREYSAPFDGLSDAELRAARRSPAVWVATNPGMPHRIGPETVVGELDSLGDGPELDRERFSVGDWPVEDADLRWDVITERAWSRRRGAAPRPEPAPQFVLAVAGSWPDARWCSIAARWADGDERVVEVVDRREGSWWVVERAAEIAAKLDPEGKGTLLGVGVAKSGTAYAALAADIAGSDLPWMPMDTGQETQAAAGLKDAVDGDAPCLRHYGQTVLDESVGAAGKHHIGDRWRWDRSGTSDPIEAVALADGLYAVARPRLPAFY